MIIQFLINLTSFIHFFVQLLLRSGRTPDEALMILVPEAYKNHPTLSIKYPEVFSFDDLKFYMLLRF